MPYLIVLIFFIKIEENIAKKNIKANSVKTSVNFNLTSNRPAIRAPKPDAIVEIELKIIKGEY